MNQFHEMCCKCDFIVTAQRNIFKMVRDTKVITIGHYMGVYPPQVPYGQPHMTIKRWLKYE